MDDLSIKSGASGPGVLYYYCDYAEPLTLEPTSIYRALLQQMFLQGYLAEDVVEHIIEKLRYNVNGLNEQELTNSLCAAARDGIDIHVVLDGLDEGSRDMQHTVSKLLHRLFHGGRGCVRIIVTCRDEGHLLKDLSDYHHVHVSVGASAADMEYFITNAVAAKISSGDITLRNQALKQDIISRLIEKAQGILVPAFLCV